VVDDVVADLVRTVAHVITLLLIQRFRVPSFSEGSKNEDRRTKIPPPTRVWGLGYGQRVAVASRLSRARCVFIDHGAEPERNLDWSDPLLRPQTPYPLWRAAIPTRNQGFCGVSRPSRR
jgi:hypothetical protein